MNIIIKGMFLNFHLKKKEKEEFVMIAKSSARILFVQFTKPISSKIVLSQGLGGSGFPGKHLTANADNLESTLTLAFGGFL